MKELTSCERTVSDGQEKLQSGREIYRRDILTDGGHYAGYRSSGGSGDPSIQKNTGEGKRS
jgi:hypothetical protein